MLNIEIRNMRDNDCRQVSRVVSASFTQAANLEALSASEIDAYVAGRGSETATRDQLGEYQCIVANLEEQIVGMIAVKDNEITKLYVDPPFHRCGVGRRLFNTAERIVTENQYAELIAWAAFDSAIGFYEAMGMSATGRKFDILGKGTGSNTMLMNKSLHGSHVR